MRRLGILSALIVCLLARPDGAVATLIDFEVFPGGGAIPAGTLITDQFASVGVAKFETDNAIGPGVVQFGLDGQSGLNALGAAIEGPTAFFDPIRIFFSIPVSEASILALDVGAAGLVLEAFDFADHLVDSASIFAVDDGFGNFATLAVAGTGIERLVVRQLLSGQQLSDGYVIDDLRFDAAAGVPEPSSAVLLGSALIALTALARLRPAASRLAGIRRI